MNEDRRTVSRRSLIQWLRLSLLVAVLLAVSALLLTPRLYPAACKHSDSIPQGLGEYKQIVDINQCSAAARILVQLAFTRVLVGTERSEIDSQLAAADNVSVTHDINFSPTADDYTFNLPSIDPNLFSGQGIEFCVTVCRMCGQVIDVTMHPKTERF